ncbi:MAG TPA: DNA primase [bacterium]|nr:DNA primase [bacterium]
MMIPDHTLAEITDRLDMVDVVSGYVTLKRRGNRYWGLCPFHTEKTPSFSITPDKSVYYCFGCHQGGSLYTFIMETEKLDFVEAVRFLARLAGIELELEQRDSSRRDAYLELYRRVSGSLHFLLSSHARATAARNYLMSRGVSQDTLNCFQLGYAPSDGRWLFDFLIEKSYSREFLLDCGLFLQDRQGSPRPLFRDRVIFPIRNSRQEIIAFGGRNLSDYGPKYLNTPETSFFRKGENLFGPPGALKRIRETNSFILVEGYMDVLALYQGGIDSCVAPLGTAVSVGQFKLLKRYSRIGILLFDGDEAGIRATERAINLGEQQGMVIEVVSLPENVDPADIIEKEGAETLKKSLKYPINGFQFLLNSALSRYDYKTPDGKQGIFGFLNSYIATVESQVRRDGYLRVLAEKLQVDYESARSDFINRENRVYKTDVVESPWAETLGGLSTDLFLVFAVAANRDQFSRLRVQLSVEDFEDTRADS